MHARHRPQTQRMMAAGRDPDFRRKQGGPARWRLAAALDAGLAIGPRTVECIGLVAISPAHPVGHRRDSAARIFPFHVDTQAPAARQPGGEVLLPGEPERRARAERDLEVATVDVHRRLPLYLRERLGERVLGAAARLQHDLLALDDVRVHAPLRAWPRREGPLPKRLNWPDQPATGVLPRQPSGPPSVGAWGCFTRGSLFGAYDNSKRPSDEFSVRHGEVSIAPSY